MVYLPIPTHRYAQTMSNAMSRPSAHAVSEDAETLFVDPNRRSGWAIRASLKFSVIVLLDIPSAR